RRGCRGRRHLQRDRRTGMARREGLAVPRPRAKFMIDPDAFARLDALLLAALDLPRSERAEFLDAACAGDAQLRRDLESLIAGSDRDGVLEQHALQILSGSSDRKE